MAPGWTPLPYTWNNERKRLGVERYKLFAVYAPRHRAKSIHSVVLSFNILCAWNSALASNCAFLDYTYLEGES